MCLDKMATDVLLAWSCFGVCSNLQKAQELDIILSLSHAPTAPAQGATGLFLQDILKEICCLLHHCIKYTMTG